MDPNETLNQIRALVARIEAVREDEYLDLVELGRDLAESANALDEWLSKGGYVPDDWATPETKRLLGRQ